MKKFVILPLVAVATLGLAACDKSAPVDNTANVSEITVNSEDTLDVNSADAASLNVTDNATVVDNATALDSAGNVTAK